MAITKWLAIYVDDHGVMQSAMLTPKDGGELPFGFDASRVGVPGMNSGVTLIEMPDDPAYRPMIVDSDNVEEVALQFIDL